MFFRPQKQLYSLPCHKALLLERRYGWVPVAVICRCRLETVECAERAVDECYRRRRRVLEEYVVVAAYVAIPSCDL